MKKRFLSMLLVTVLAVSLIAGFALSASATPASYPFQSTVPITGHGWTGWQNVLNSIPSTSDYDSMRADGTPYAVLKATLDSAKSTYGEIADGASPNYDSVTTSTGQTLTAYADSVFGRAFYMFDGGKQLAYELWNSTVDSSVKLIRTKANYFMSPPIRRRYIIPICIRRQSTRSATTQEIVITTKRSEVLTPVDTKRRNNASKPLKRHCRLCFRMTENTKFPTINRKEKLRLKQTPFLRAGTRTKLSQHRIFSIRARLMQNSLTKKFFPFAFSAMRASRAQAKKRICAL